MSDGIPNVRFADPEMLRKMGFPIPEGSGAAAQSPNIPQDFSFDANPNPAQVTSPFDTFVAPPPATGQPTNQPLPSMASAGAVLPVTGIEVAPQAAATQAQAPTAKTDVVGAKPATTLDSSNAMFTDVYRTLTAKQKLIVDDMAGQLDIADLFKTRRFKLNYTLIPGKLKVGFQSMTQQEIQDFWEALSDVKGSNLFIDALVAKKHCARIVVALNNKPIGEPEQREELFGTFDHTFVQLLFDYVKLFEIARMRFLHQGDFTENPTE